MRRPWRRRVTNLVLGVAVPALALIVRPAPGGPLLLEEVARAGRPLGSGGELVVEVSDLSMLGDGGHVALVCTTRRPGEADAQPALWSGLPGDLTRVARVRDAAPALQDRPILESFRVAGIDAAGRGLFDGKTRGRNAQLRTTAVWYGAGEFAGRVARAGERMVGGGPGDAPASSVRAVALTPGGVLLVSAAYMSTPERVRSVYYVGRPDGLSPLPGPEAAVAAADGRAFGCPLGSVALNERGQVLLMTTPSDCELPYPQTLWLGRPEALVPVAASDEPAADWPEPGRYRLFHESPFGRGLNDAGDVVFAGSAGTGPDSPTSVDNDADEPGVLGIWAGGPDNLALVAKAGDPMPGCAASETLRWPRDGALSVDGSGAVLLAGEIVGNGEADAACWIREHGTLTLLARQGNPIDAEGLPPGVLATPVGELRPRLSREGRFLQAVELSGAGVTEDNRFGLALFERGQGWRLVTRFGDPVDLGDSPGGGSVLRSIEWVSGVNALGQFLLIGEVDGQPGPALYRVTIVD